MMGRYRPDLIDGIAGFSLRRQSKAIDAPPPRRDDAARLRPGAPILNEPEPTTATIEDWIAYRQEVMPLADRDPSMRVALAVAEAQIAKLRDRMRAGGKRAADRDPGDDDPA